MSDSNLSSYQKRKRAELFSAIETSRPVLPEDKLKMLDEFIEKNEAVVKEVEKEKNVMADNPIKESELASQTISYANPFGGDDAVSNVSEVQLEQNQGSEERIQDLGDTQTKASVNNVANVELIKEEVTENVVPEVNVQRIPNIQVVEDALEGNEENNSIANKKANELGVISEVNVDDSEALRLEEKTNIDIINNKEEQIDTKGVVETLESEQNLAIKKPVENAQDLLEAQRKKLEEELPELTESQKRLIIEQERMKSRDKQNPVAGFFMKIFGIIWAELNRIDVVKKFMVEYNSNLAIAKENALENYTVFGNADSVKLGMELIVDKYLNSSEQAKNKAFIDKTIDEKYSLSLFKQGFVISAIFISILLLFGIYENITDNIIPVTLLREVLFIIPFAIFAFIIYKLHNKIYLKNLFPLTSMTAGIFGLVVAMIFMINSYIFITVPSLIVAIILIYFGFTRLDLDLKKLSKEFSFEDKDKQCPTCGKLVPKGENYCYNCERNVY